ncbi:MAG: hypothetical protein U0359_09385 [Byssovorax sp.]
MSTSLEHLPPHKRDQVTAIAALIAAEVPAEMVILFGSYARRLTVSPEVEAKITRCTDPEVLDGWIRRATNAASAEEAVDAKT